MRTRPSVAAGYDGGARGSGGGFNHGGNYQDDGLAEITTVEADAAAWGDVIHNAVKSRPAIICL